MVSEEDEDPIIGTPEGQYGVAFDPLDGFVGILVVPTLPLGSFLRQLVEHRMQRCCWNHFRGVQVSLRPHPVREI